MDKPRATNLTLYAFCSIATVLSTWPNYDALNAGMLAIFVILLLSYAIRSREEKDTLVHHHMTFIIRTIWIYSLFASFGISAAGYNIYMNHDQSAITAMVDQISAGVMPSLEDMEQIEQAYLAANRTLIIESFIICMFPALLYLIWRVTRGATRAFHNYRVQNLYSWI